MTALREIRILQLLKHDNIVNLVEICRSKGKRKGNANVRFLCREGGREGGMEALTGIGFTCTFIGEKDNGSALCTCTSLIIRVLRGRALVR